LAWAPVLVTTDWTVAEHTATDGPCLQLAQRTQCHRLAHRAMPSPLPDHSRVGLGRHDRPFVSRM